MTTDLRMSRSSSQSVRSRNRGNIREDVWCGIARIVIVSVTVSVHTRVIVVSIAVVVDPRIVEVTVSVVVDSWGPYVEGQPGWDCGSD